MFEVVITSTGKHYLKGEVVTESLGLAPHRPTPLPQGAVSGAKGWKKKDKNDKATSNTSSTTMTSKPRPNSLSTFSQFRVTDIVLVAIAALVLCAAVLCHYTQLFTVVWTR